MAEKYRPSYDNKNSSIQNFIADNCCADKSILENIFGDVPVKLDGFHAKRRIISTIKKGTFSNRTRLEFFKEVRRIMRMPDDQIGSRSQETAPPEKIIEYLDNLLENFGDVLPGKTKEAIGNLRSHAATGCLRFISLIYL